MTFNSENLVEFSRSVRIIALKSVYHSYASHIGSGYSCADLLVYLYSRWLRVFPDTRVSPERDRFILSKGHAAAVYYSVLAEFGFIPKDWMDKYCQFGSILGGHVDHNVPGVEISTGSLGHGLPIAVCGSFDDGTFHRREDQKRSGDALQIVREQIPG